MSRTIELQSRGSVPLRAEASESPLCRNVSNESSSGRFPKSWGLVNDSDGKKLSCSSQDFPFDIGTERQATRLDMDEYESEQAMLLHSSVPKWKWCMTREDLMNFKQIVIEAMQGDRMYPHEGDDFDPNDRDIGPNLYTVNKQVIMPETKKAGMMSWALMLHPEGLNCDLFITHAWQEGIFELINKVVHSWPRDARHAYCCVFSNPQNLDICSLIAHPSQSPFALALGKAQYMLVVPNRQTSIYTRLWCAYEAFLCYKGGLDIYTAMPSTVPQIRISLLKLAGVCCLAAVITLLDVVVLNAFELQGEFVKHNNASNTLVYFFLPLCCAIGQPLIRVIFCRCGAAGAAASVVFLIVRWNDHERAGLEKLIGDFSLNGADPHMRLKVVVVDVLCLIFFALVEIDLVRKAAREVEANMLMFSGSVRDAECSVEQDKLTIFSEIGEDRIEDVDKTIRLLLQTGIATKRLRRTFQEGVDVRGMMFVEWAIVFIALTCPSCLAYILWYTSVAGEKNANEFVAYMLLAAVMTWSISLVFLRNDGRAFAVSVLKKSMGAAITIDAIVCVVARFVDTNWLRIMAATSCSFLFSGWILSMVRLDRLARVPRCGRPIAQMLANNLPDHIQGIMLIVGKKLLAVLLSWLE